MTALGVHPIAGALGAEISGAINDYPGTTAGSMHRITLAGDRPRGVC